jgi:hypothetical protein
VNTGTDCLLALLQQFQDHRAHDRSQLFFRVIGLKPPPLIKRQRKYSVLQHSSDIASGFNDAHTPTGKPDNSHRHREQQSLQTGNSLHTPTGYMSPAQITHFLPGAEVHPPRSLRRGKSSDHAFSSRSRSASTS